MEREVWIALACVTALPGNEQLVAGQGAYVYVLAPAENDLELLILARRVLAEKCLKVGLLEQAEPFSLHQVKYEIGDNLRSLAEQARASGGLQVGGLHPFGADPS